MFTGDRMFVNCKTTQKVGDHNERERRKECVMNDGSVTSRIGKDATNSFLNYLI